MQWMASPRVEATEAVGRQPRLQIAMVLRPFPQDCIPVQADRTHPGRQRRTSDAATKAIRASLVARIDSETDGPQRRRLLAELEARIATQISEKSTAELRSLEIQAWMEHSMEADFRRHYRTQPSTRGDFEHAHEDARRIVCAVESGLPSYLLTGDHTRRAHVGIRALGGAPADFDCEAPTLWLGMGPPPSWLTGAHPNGRQVVLARRYWELAAFRQAAGRSFVEVPTLSHVAHALRAMARLGHTRAFVKACAFKRGAWTVELPQSASRMDGAWACLFAAAGASALRLPDIGNETGFMVQGWRPMVDETRCFVVDGRLVAAVPVRREDTVYDSVRRPGFRIEPRSCLHPSDAPSRPDRLGPANRARFARRTIAAIGAEQPDLRDYVLDVACDEVTGEPLAIELNPLANAGLYACDPGILLTAARAAVERSRRPPARSLELVA